MFDIRCVYIVSLLFAQLLEYAKRTHAMSDRRDQDETFEFFYSRPQSDAAREVERSVLGHAVGLNGYTTVEQADRLREVLLLGPTRRLLDVGAGRGWPGSHLAGSSGCRLVSTDVPVDALREAKSNLEAAGLRERSETAAADGRALPFRSECFDAVVHADVLC